MSPTERVGGAALKAKPAVVEDGQGLTIHPKLAEKSAVPAAALEKMLTRLGDLSERMGRMESSQSGQVDGNARALRSRASLVRYLVQAPVSISKPWWMPRLPNADRAYRRTPALVHVDHLMLGMTWLTLQSKQVRSTEWFKLLNLVSRTRNARGSIPGHSDARSAVLSTLKGAPRRAGRSLKEAGITIFRR